MLLPSTLNLNKQTLGIIQTLCHILEKGFELVKYSVRGVGGPCNEPAGPLVAPLHMNMSSSSLL